MLLICELLPLCKCKGETEAFTINLLTVTNERSRLWLYDLFKPIHWILKIVTLTFYYTRLSWWYIDFVWIFWIYELLQGTGGLWP